MIVGGSSGIGLAIARRMIADGEAVILVGRDRERMAGAVAFLLGDDARHVTGTTLTVDGGYLA